MDFFFCNGGVSVGGVGYVFGWAYSCGGLAVGLFVDHLSFIFNVYDERDRTHCKRMFIVWLFGVHTALFLCGFLTGLV